MCAKPLVSFYEGLFAFAAAFVAAVALDFTVSYKNSIAAVTHPQRGLIPRDHVIRSFESQGAESYNIVLDGEVVGGTVLSIHPEPNEAYSDEDTPGGEGFCRFEKQMR